MSMTDRELFKFGFLVACADAGLSINETRDAVTAAIVAGSPIKQAGVLSAIPHVAGYGLLASLGLGAGVGYLGAKMTEDDVQPADIKNQELVAAYNQMADRARRTMQLRRYRDAAAPKPRRLRVH